MNEYTELNGMRRAQSLRPRMAPGDRAKLFAPFAALKGFDESAHARERTLVPRPDIAVDRQEQLDRRLRSLNRGDTVTVTWFEVLRDEEGLELGRCRITSGQYLANHPTSGVLVLTTARIETKNILDLGKR